MDGWMDVPEAAANFVVFVVVFGLLDGVAAGDLGVAVVVVGFVGYEIDFA